MQDRLNSAVSMGKLGVGPWLSEKEMYENKDQITEKCFDAFISIDARIYFIFSCECGFGGQAGKDNGL